MHVSAYIAKDTWEWQQFSLLRKFHLNFSNVNYSSLAVVSIYVVYVQNWSNAAFVLNVSMWHTSLNKMCNQTRCCWMEMENKKKTNDWMHFSFFLCIFDKRLSYGTPQNRLASVPRCAYWLECAQRVKNVFVYIHFDCYFREKVVVLSCFCFSLSLSRSLAQSQLGSK